MIEYWRVYGRIVTDGAFRDTLTGLVVADATQMSEVQVLTDLLLEEGYRLSRWETLELNRTLGKVKADPTNAATTLENRWVGSPAQGETARLLGAICIDKVFRNATITSCGGGPQRLLEFLSNPPQFPLASLAEARRVVAFLTIPQTAQSLDQMEHNLWVVTGSPRASCWNGFSREGSDYEHLRAPLISGKLKQFGISPSSFEALLSSDDFPVLFQ